MQNPDANRAAGVLSLVLRHCEERSDEAIHLSTCGTMDCFASLAMTTGWPLNAAARKNPRLNDIRQREAAPRLSLLRTTRRY